MKYLEEIKESYQEGEYNIPYPQVRSYGSHVVIDEDKSVKWNREERVRLNDLRKEKLAKFSKDRSDQVTRLKKDVSEAMAYENPEMKPHQIEKVLNYAFDNNSSCREDFFDAVIELCELF